MREDIKKLGELMRTDEGFQAKLKSAAEAYTGDQNSETAFHAVVARVAEEYGISVTFQEFQEYMSEISGSDKRIDLSEMDQVTGGSDINGGGVGYSECDAVGWGLGGGAGAKGVSFCFFVGLGSGSVACLTAGVSS